MLKKLAALLMAAAMLLSMTAAGAETAQAPVTISFYSTQAGVDDATVALLDEFMAQHPGITVEYYPCGDDQLAAWLALYSAGTAPTVSLLDVGQILNYSDYMYDFNQGDTEWMSHVLSGWEYCQKEGSEAIYGMACQLFSEWLGDKETQRAILNGMYTGETKLMELEHFNNLMDVFDILKQYNINDADPLADTQEGDLEMLATGEVATMFQGDWNWLQIQTFAERDELGMMPLPLTNDETDPRNSKILGSCPKAYCVDVYQNTPEQQAAGVELAKWLALSDEGKEFMVTNLGSTLPFDEVNVVNENPLAVETQKYLNEGRILDISTCLCEGPTDFWLVCGPYMQAYLANQMDRATLAAQIEAYFQDI